MNRKLTNITVVEQAKAEKRHWIMNISVYDGLEILPCRSEPLNEAGETYTEPCEPKEVHFWTVYGHYKSGGCEAFEDFETAAKALEFAEDLQNAFPHLQEQGIYG